MRLFLLVLTCSTLSVHPLLAQGSTAAPDWNKFRDETVQVLSDYIKINTTNPPGNELESARFLRRTLEREGIDGGTGALTDEHGRLSNENIGFGLRFLWDIIRYMQ